MDERSDLAWLAGRVGRADYVLSGGTPSATDSEVAQLVKIAGAGIVCEPTHVAQTKRVSDKAGSAAHVIALIGWPTGRHHSLIKAAEARLAVEDGADEVWIAVDVDDASNDVNAVLADVIAVSQIVDEPTRFGVTIPSSIGKKALQELADAVGKVGVDVVAVGVDKPGIAELPAVTCDLAVHGAVDSLDAAADALLAGAGRVFPARG
ncbi:hypothetical protein [Corynebacterium urinipleomorphum]|uniref:hypothetical protein n=1 Tax=Corynebacterium urinipleomorphum TaxID=1852380 RepID=UPI000B354DD6|nr:hypothetical protein [Corynebacterium urinipleomorphum]